MTFIARAIFAPLPFTKPLNLHGCAKKTSFNNKLLIVQDISSAQFLVYVGDVHVPMYMASRVFGSIIFLAKEEFDGKLTNSKNQYLVTLLK